MKLGDQCQYWMTPTFQCGRVPVVVDYVEVDAVKGERLISSNCFTHDQAEARRYAMAKGWERRSRKVAEAA